MSRKKLRVLLAVPEHAVVPEDVDGVSDEDFFLFKDAFDVMEALDALGHEHRQVGLADELGPLRREILRWEPSIVFNLLDRFRGRTFYDQHVTGYLQLMRTPFTGCNPRGLVLASDKPLSKKIVLYHRIRTARFLTVLRGRKPKLTKAVAFPLIVKVHMEEASTGIAQASVVHTEEQLDERVRYVHENFKTAAIVEEYVEGRELSVGVVGNERLQVFPPWELHMDGLPEGVPRIATHNIKWNLDYQEKYRIRLGPAQDLSDDLARKIHSRTRRIYKALQLTGYARIDYRLRDDGRLYFLEANANPDISRDEELASAAKAAGLPYEQLIQKVLSLGIRWSETF